VNLRKSRFLAATLLLLIPEAFLTPHVANADTAGSGVCQQTFTVSGTGTVTVFENGGYCYVAFKNTGSLNSQTVFTWTRPSLVTSSDVLVVGGGGGGGSRHGGGGGAGGFVQADSYSISSASTISIAVGAGGSASSSSSGSSGQNSYFKPTAASSSGLLALGGGFGSAVASGNGGSGGGAGSSQTGGSVTSQAQTTFANASLTGISFGSIGAGGANDTNVGDDPNDYWAGGGGGGATSAGTRPLSNGTPVSTFPSYSSATAVGGRGGDGKSASWITSTVASNLTVGQTSAGTVYFAGGGGGGMGVDGQGGVGGLGGGANGSRAESSGNAGSAFTGGGGGGSGFDDINKSGSPETVPNPPGGAGGSGVVLLRFVTPDATAPTITGPSSATGATSSISISENTTSVHTFTANESVTWSKSGTDGSFFAINSSSGVITITARDFESPADNGNNNTYVVVITATDGASNATNQTLTVTVTNINEAPTITINSSNATHAITQAENSATVVTYTATDVDAGSSLSFSVSGTDAADFAIDSSSGVLTFASNPDFEAPADSDTNNTYVVVITVSDGALSDTQTLTITITNANESASINAPTVSGSVNKGISATITVTLNTDGKVRFFVGGKRISNCLARSTTGSYPSFTATCAWKPPVMGSQSLTARVTPSDNSFSATTSPSTSVLVTKRANSR